MQNEQIMQSSTNPNVAAFSLQRIGGGATSNLSTLSAPGISSLDYYNALHPVSGTQPNAISVTVNAGVVVGTGGGQQLATIVSAEIQKAVNNGVIR
jgi:hypothetical protein